MTKKLSLKSAAKAAATMQECLSNGDGVSPSMVSTLWMMFNDPKTDSKVRLNIANLFARQTLMREQLARKAGLSKFGGSDNRKQTLNIKIDEIKLLPQEQRDLLERVFLESLGGTKIPSVVRSADIGDPPGADDHESDSAKES